MTAHPLFPELETALEEARTEHTRLLAELPVAQERVRQALHAYEIAQARMSRLIVAVNRACAPALGVPGGTTTPQLGDLLARERAQYNAAGLALTKARNRLADVKWHLECRVDDVVKLERLLYPPAVPLEPAAPRSKPAVDDGADIIYFPPSRVA